MRKQIELICEFCDIKYEKDLSEHKRNIKLNRKSFCSLSCSSKFRMSERSDIKIPEAFKENWGKSFWDECSPFRYYLKKARNRKKWNTNLDCEYLMNLWEEQDGRCIFTGLNLTLKTYKKSMMEIGLKAASLDRIDSTKGYIKGNVQWTCVGINLLKGNREDCEVIEFIKEIKN